jgi:LPS O-antigen subunit length determinant protein (WzzB/FepE family)
MADNARQALQLDPQLQNVLQKLAGNLAELNLLLTKASTHLVQPTVETARAKPDLITETQDNEPKVEDLFKERVPDAARLSRLFLP